ncbi:MAG: hypothetical protein WC624_04530, partial [Candidatus Margulisiibacteriota bacterium]
MVVSRVNNSFLSRAGNFIHTGVLGTALRTAPMIAGAVGGLAINCGGTSEDPKCTRSTTYEDKNMLNQLITDINVCSFTGDCGGFDFIIHYPASGVPANSTEQSQNKEMVLTILSKPETLGMNDRGEFSFNKAGWPSCQSLLSPSNPYPVSCSPFIGLTAGDIKGQVPVGYADVVSLPSTVTPGSEAAKNYAEGKIKHYSEVAYDDQGNFISGKLVAVLGQMAIKAPVPTPVGIDQQYASTQVYEVKNNADYKGRLYVQITDPTCNSEDADKPCAMVYRWVNVNAADGTISLSADNIKEAKELSILDAEIVTDAAKGIKGRTNAMLFSDVDNEGKYTSLDAEGYPKANQNWEGKNLYYVRSLAPGKKAAYLYYGNGKDEGGLAIEEPAYDAGVGDGGLAEAGDLDGGVPEAAVPEAGAMDADSAVEEAAAAADAAAVPA